MKLLREYIRELLTEGTSGEYYHMSPNKFDAFHQQFHGGWRANDVGFHFGTKETAMIVADKLKQEGRVKPGDVVYLYTVGLNASNPIQLDENRTGGWTVNSILNAMFEGFGGESHPSISEEAVDEYWDDVVTTPSGENLKDLDYDQHLLMSEFKSWLNNLGFDSISYVNTFEGGGESIIVLDPNQITIKNIEEYQVP